MTSDSSRNLKVGLTVIISILIVLYGIAFLKSMKLGVSTNDLAVYFKDVNGLNEGDPVSVNGVNEGKITKIEPTGDSVRVEFNLSKEIEIRKDYVITVSMIELMSGKQIYIKPGVDKTLADVSKPLVGTKNTDVISLIGTMNDIGETVKQLTSKLGNTVDNLDKAINNVNGLVGDEGLKSNIRGSASNFNAASKNLNLMIADTRKNIGALTLNLNGVVSKVGTTVDETRPELTETLQNMKLLAVKLDTLATGLNSIVSSAKDSSSTVGKLLTKDDLYNNLNKTLISIDKLVKQIKQDGIRLKLF